MSFHEKSLPTVLALNNNIIALGEVRKKMLTISFDLWSPYNHTDAKTGSVEQVPCLTAEMIGFDADMMRDIARNSIIKEIDRKIADCREQMRELGVVLDQKPGESVVTVIVNRRTNKKKPPEK